MCHTMPLVCTATPIPDINNHRALRQVHMLCINDLAQQQYATIIGAVNNAAWGAECEATGISCGTFV